MNIWKNRLWSPMLFKEVSKPFNDKKYLFEVKFDGMRAIIYASHDKVSIYNRHKKEITYLFPELNNIKVSKNVIFDGEIICLKNGKPSFSKLQERSHLKNKLKIDYQSKINPVVFICFDILYEDKDLTNLSLLERKKELNKYKNNEYFYKSFYIKEYGIKLFKKIKRLNLEGIVAKEMNSKYLINKRVDTWLKIKNYYEEYFYIGGFIEKNNIVSILLGEYKNNLLYFIGKVTLSKKRRLYSKIKKKKLVNNSSFINYKNRNINYINPNLKVKVRYMTRTKSNNLRQAFISD